MSKKNYPHPEPISPAVVSATDFTGLEQHDPHLEKHLTERMQKEKPNR